MDIRDVLGKGLSVTLGNTSNSGRTSVSRYLPSSLTPDFISGLSRGS